MANDPNWVDYTNLGLNIANTALNVSQLREMSAISDQLQHLGQIEANRERRWQIERALRDFLFEQESKWLHLSEEVPQGSVVLWIGLQIIQNNIDTVPVTSESFSEFPDKDRVRKFRGDLAATIRQCEANLNSSQMLAARQGLAYITQQASLQEYIVMRKAQKFLSETDAEYTQLDTRLLEWKYQNTGVFWGGLLTGVTLVPFLLYQLGQLVSINMGTLLACAGAPIWIVVALVTLRKMMLSQEPSRIRRDELRTQRKSATKQIPAEARQRELIHLFGSNATVEQLEAMQNERNLAIPKLLATH